jgi:hypothetical protein
MKKSVKEQLDAMQINDYEQENKINMAYWFPLLKQIGMRVPKTILIDTGDCELGILTDGNIPKNIDNFLNRLTNAINEIGLPCFLRTGMTSNKHDWKDSCYIESTDRDYLINHISNIVKHSFIANIGGLPFDYSIWAVRQLIPTKPLFYCFNGMPITKERRLFVKNGKVICNHPYWPKEAFGYHKINGKLDIEKLSFLNKEDEKELKLMAEYVGRYFTGYWSMDFLQDIENKWWLTDMATGERSYHYDGCSNLSIKK